ncbi:hypothetical protein Peur_072354 [Populus x canadensis]
MFSEKKTNLLMIDCLIKLQGLHISSLFNHFRVQIYPLHVFNYSGNPFRCVKALHAH